MSIEDDMTSLINSILRQKIVVESLLRMFKTRFSKENPTIAFNSHLYSLHIFFLSLNYKLNDRGDEYLT
jgi:hypothetical protein